MFPHQFSTNHLKPSTYFLHYWIINYTDTQPLIQQVQIHRKITTETRFVTHSHTEVRAIFLSNRKFLTLNMCVLQKKYFMSAVRGTGQDAPLLIFHPPVSHLTIHHPAYSIPVWSTWDIGRLRSPSQQNQRLFSMGWGTSACRRGPAAPAAATSRNWEFGRGKGSLSHLVMCQHALFMQHANRSKRSGAWPAAHSHFYLQQAPLWRCIFCSQQPTVPAYAHLT